MNIIIIYIYKKHDKYFFIFVAYTENTRTKLIVNITNSMLHNTTHK